MKKIDLETQRKISAAQLSTRRHFFGNCSVGLGALALSQWIGRPTLASTVNDDKKIAVRTKPAKQVIYLHMAGSPPQHELFDFKPELAKRDMQLCPEEMIEGKTFAFIKGRPKLMGPAFPYRKFGKSGMELCEKFPTWVRTRMTFV